jgi:hypothetical protein
MSEPAESEEGVDPKVVIIDVTVDDRTLEAFCYVDGTIFGGTAGLVRKYSGQSLSDVIRGWRQEGYTVAWSRRPEEAIDAGDDELFSDEEPAVEPDDPPNPPVPPATVRKRGKRPTGA